VITNLPQQTNAGLAKAFFGAWARVLLRMLSPVIARSDSDEAIQFLPSPLDCFALLAMTKRVP